MNNRVEIYSKDWCPFCDRAKTLLQAKGVAYTEIDVTDDATREQEMRRRSGRRSVPQIFIGENHVGGFDDLKALDQAGELDPIIGVDSKEKRDRHFPRVRGRFTASQDVCAVPRKQNKMTRR